MDTTIPVTQVSFLDKLAEALSIAQSQIEPPLKKCKVDFIDKNGRRVAYNYADLSDVLASIKKPFADNGLCLFHQLLYEGSLYCLKTTLLHKSGQAIFSIYPLPDPKTSQIKPQEFGSSLTYARRYSINALAGVASEEDDDGNGAVVIQPPKALQSRPVPTPKTSSEGAKIEIIPPGAFIMPLGSKAVVGKKLSDLDAETLQKVIAWSAKEIKANKKPENKPTLIRINTNAQLVLNAMPVKPLPEDPGPMPEGGESAPPIEEGDPGPGEADAPSSFEQEFPPDDMPPDYVPEPEKAPEPTQSKEASFVLPIDFKGLGLKGQTLGELPEVSLYTISQDLEKVLRTVPPPKNLSQLMGINSAIKKYFKSVKA